MAQGLLFAGALIRRLVVQDRLDHFGRINAGEMIRLDVSLSRTLPQKRGFLRIVSAVFGPIRGKARFEGEYGEGILKSGM